MKYKFSLPIFSILLFQITTAQETQNTIHEKDLNWTFTIPKGFERIIVPKEIRESGKKAIEEATNSKFVKNNSIKLFSYKFDNLNYFDASYQKLDSYTIKNYDDEVINMNKLLYKTIIYSDPNAQIDSTFTKENIDNIVFTKLHLIINKKVNLIVYKKLFDDKDLTFNILYSNSQKGNEVINEFRKSKFKP